MSASFVSYHALKARIRISEVYSFSFICRMHANLLIVDTMYDELNRFCEKKSNIILGIKGANFVLWLIVLHCLNIHLFTFFFPQISTEKSMTTHLRSDVVLDNLYSQVQRFSKWDFDFHHIYIQMSSKHKNWI